MAALYDYEAAGRPTLHTTALVGKVCAIVNPLQAAASAPDASRRLYSTPASLDDLRFCGLHELAEGDDPSGNALK